MVNEEKKQGEPSEFVKHARAALEASLNQWKSLIPPAFWEHGRVARREALLALRSLVDSAIERLEEKEEQGKSRNRGKAKVTVE